jgi:hypothetical protein
MRRSHVCDQRPQHLNVCDFAHCEDDRHLDQQTGRSKVTTTSSMP